MKNIKVSVRVGWKSCNHLACRFVSRKLYRMHIQHSNARQIIVISMVVETSIFHL